MEAASEALGQEEAEETSALSSIMPQADEPQEQAAPQVKTNASSVSAVLQRRRPKVLSPRNGATAHS